MNLHALVSSAIARVNPQRSATFRHSLGYTIAADGTQVPAYQDFPGISAQFQDLSSDDLQKIDGLNIQGNRSAVYLNGSWDGIIRPDQQGGDLVVYGGQTWLVAAVLESWPDWTKLAIVLQNRT